MLQSTAVSDLPSEVRLKVLYFALFGNIRPASDIELPVCSMEQAVPQCALPKAIGVVIALCLNCRLPFHFGGLQARIISDNARLSALAGMEN